MSYSYDSSILANSMIFEGQKAARMYLKKKDAALKARGNEVQDRIAEAKEAREEFKRLVQWLPAEFSCDDVVTEYCGLGREWNANGKAVTQFAEANGIDQGLAAELVSRQMTVAQDYAQATRGLKFGKYVSWLHDAMQEADDEGDLAMPSNMEEILIGAYNRAAQWNQPGDGLLIKDFSCEIGMSELLPEWAEALKKNMPSAEQAMAARKRIANRAAAAASAEQEAEQELVQQFGNF